MELQLSKYNINNILSSYEFIFGQYLGGQLAPIEFIEDIPTIHIFEEICKEIRIHYLSREDSNVNEIEEVERNCVLKLSVALSLPEKKLSEIYEGLIVRFKESINKTI